MSGCLLDAYSGNREGGGGDKLGGKNLPAEVRERKSGGMAEKRWIANRGQYYVRDIRVRCFGK